MLLRTLLVPNIHRQTRERDACFLSVQTQGTTTTLHRTHVLRELTKDAISVISWNINGGFENKWNVSTLRNYLCTYDVLFLIECWIENTFDLSVDGFVTYVFPRTKSKHKQGGGIILLVRSSVDEYIKVVENNYDTII